MTERSAQSEQAVRANGNQVGNPGGERAKAIMVQGTMSNVGKSLIAAGLCRVFAQDGYKVAPFKSQNMALNSSITADGSEMGRAQVMQAEAAGVAPEATMNPILLKPTNDTGSQVIVCGHPIGNMGAREYFAYKKNLVPQIMEAYNDLASRFDIIVIEGAGSPAEINLKADDIVNMGMAKMAKAPVLLVGDIDRGGVFAQLLGTMMLLDDDERDMVKALVVNKFRGDPTILDPGIDILEERSGVPVAGVVPYTILDVDDEDSLSERLDVHSTAAAIDIAVVRLPKLSNFTDFIGLDAIDGVGVRYVSRAADLREPDLIILPGTKNTIADLKWLRESGMEAAILKRAAAGTVVFGICGGFQMLGCQLDDPDGVEGGGSIRGMGLLPLRTVFSADKHQVQVEGVLGEVGGSLAGLSGVPVRGYEIHMGRTEGAGDGEVFRTPMAGMEAPAVYRAGDVYGSYIHGIFDTRESAAAVVGALMGAKGLDPADVQAVDMDEHKQQEYDKLADALRNSLDMDLIYKILNEGV